MAHVCTLPHDFGSCVELVTGEYLLSLSSVDVSLTQTVDYCPFCGSRAGQPATLTAISLDFAEAIDDW